MIFFFLQRVGFAAVMASGLVAISCSLHAEDRQMLCSEGFGSFDSKFSTGITVSVVPMRSSSFASRVCSASLSWNGTVLPVMPRASEIDLDVLGADFGLGSPVVAFAVRMVGSDKVVQYSIYSLKKPAQLLRTLKGGSYFNAADTDMDGRVEIWTDDAEAMAAGFDNLPLSALDGAPTIVLRFEQRRLMDVSAEFRADYDRQIAGLKAELSPSQLSFFKASDGRLVNRSAMPIEESHRLVTTKVKILEIVWAYLYSGRETEAWQALTDLWPPGDVERTHTLIDQVRARGMHSNVDGTVERPTGFHIRKHAPVFDAEMQYAKDDHMQNFQVDVMPREILLRRPPSPATGQANLNAEVVLNLVIDSAGKVRSAKSEGKPDKDLIASTANWKFIPAHQGWTRSGEQHALRCDALPVSSSYWRNALRLSSAAFIVLLWFRSGALQAVDPVPPDSRAQVVHAYAMAELGRHSEAILAFEGMHGRDADGGTLELERSAYLQASRYTEDCGKDRACMAEDLLAVGRLPDALSAQRQQIKDIRNDQKNASSQRRRARWPERPGDSGG